jgi:hypothetical protein
MPAIHKIINLASLGSLCDAVASDLSLDRKSTKCDFGRIDKAIDHHAALEFNKLGRKGAIHNGRRIAVCTNDLLKTSAEGDPMAAVWSNLGYEFCGIDFRMTSPESPVSKKNCEDDCKNGYMGLSGPVSFMVCRLMSIAKADDMIVVVGHGFEIAFALEQAATAVCCAIAFPYSYMPIGWRSKNWGPVGVSHFDLAMEEIMFSKEKIPMRPAPKRVLE